MAGQRAKKSGSQGDGAAFQQLKQAVSSGHIGNLYIFHGEETYLRDYYLGLLKKRILTGGMEEFNYHVLPAKDCSVHRLRELTDAVPFLGERTLIVVHDFDLFKGDARTRDAMENLLRGLPEYTCLIFLYDVIEYKPDNRLKLAKTVKEKACAVNFLRQDRSALTGWIARHFRAAGQEISRSDAEYLIEQSGDLMTALASEIDKISAYARGRQITRADIDAVVIPQLRAGVFSMTSYLSAGNFDKAFSELAGLLRSQEEPVQILGALGWQLRQIYAARLAVEHRKDIKWLMKTCDIKYQGQAERVLTSARRFSLNWCRRAVLRCEETDLAMKSGSFSDSELLTGLLLELSRKHA